MRPLEGNMSETQGFVNVFTKLRRIAILARENPQLAFTSLNHCLDLELLREAFHKTRKNGAPGVDGQTWHDYEANLEVNLQALLERAKSGSYQAPPVRRVYIPKGGSPTEKRPIGIPTIEDKVLQRAVLMILEVIYERDFYNCSFGFRRGRSAHEALDTFWRQAMGSSSQWVLEVDIRKCFDTLDHGHLRELLRLRTTRWSVAAIDWKMAESRRLGGGPVVVSRRRLAARRRRLAAAGECVLALRAGCLVPRSGAAAAEGPCLSGPLRRRLCDRLHQRAGCSEGAGRHPQAFYQVRTDGSPRKDTPPPLRATAAEGRAACRQAGNV